MACPGNPNIKGSLGNPRPEDVIEFDRELRPHLLVIIDAREFERTRFSSAAMRVTPIDKEIITQRIFEQFGIVPTYLVDYPVASQELGYKPLREFLQSGACDIGAQLHPWLNPPFEEPISECTSFPGMLDRALQFEKLRNLTEVIQRNFGVRPTVYRAGRHGIGPDTPEILEELGYTVDCSILPGSDFRAFGGPIFPDNMQKPFWLGSRRQVLELPVTAGHPRALRAFGPQLRSFRANSFGSRLHLNSILAPNRLVDAVRLTPEGVHLDQAKRLTRVLLKHRHHRVFTLSYHRPSLDPGHTPYVRDQAELRAFIAWIEGYLDFFFCEIGGRAATPLAIRQFAETIRLAPSETQDGAAVGLVRVTSSNGHSSALRQKLPSVSVIIPAYNAEAFIARSITSVLQQTNRPLEIIVVDDGSHDGTAAVVGGYSAAVRLLRKANGGPASARNRGAREARGEWLAFLDADDIWMPEKLERQLEVAVAENADLVQSLLPSDRQTRYVIPRRIDFDMLWSINCIATSSVILKKSVFEQLGGFDEDIRLISVEDYNLWLRMAAADYRLITCLEELAVYTRTAGLSSQLRRFMSAQLYNVDKTGAALGISTDRILQKRAIILESFGMAYLSDRQMALARRALWGAVRTFPTIRTTGKLIISLAPRALFDAYRWVSTNVRRVKTAR